MKKIYLILIASLTFCGSIFAQQQSIWDEINPYAYYDYDILIATVDIDNNIISQNDNYSDYEVGAFVNGECRGHAFMTYYSDTPADPYPLADQLQIWYDEDESGLEVSFKLYDHSQGLEYDITSNVTVVTGENSGSYNTPTNLSAVEQATMVTQLIQLTQGWNWFSTYIVGEPTDLLQALEAGLGENGEAIWSDGDGSTDYYEDDDEWEGTLDPNGLKNNQMYMIKTTAACTMELTGMPADAVNVQITINPGWNWIGFPITEEMSVADAFANFQSEDEDMLWSNNDGTTDYYADDNEWDGTLVTLRPGQGYMYFSNSNTSKTLVFGLVKSKK